MTLYEKPIITYAEDSGIWSTIETQIKSKLPLQNLFWQDPIAFGSSSKAVAAAINNASSYQNNNVTSLATSSNIVSPASTSGSSPSQLAFSGLGSSTASQLGSNLNNVNNTATSGTNPSVVQVVGAGIPIRTIPAIDIEFQKFYPDMFPKYVPGGAQQNPYFLHIYFVGCEDNEMYKNNVRKSIQDWYQIVSSKKNHEWLIVHVVDSNPATSRKTTGSLFTTASGTSKVFDKLKNEFTGKKDRILQLKLSNNDALDSASWYELFNRMKECIISSGIQQILQIEEDARRLDQQRLMPGWNYCQYFLMKESLALTYGLLTLYDEALLVYDELEATFFQTLLEQGVPWFRRFGGTEKGDDSQSILDFRRKPYREMIAQNSITIFDFRIYLFARQCHLLAQSGKPLELCQRGKLFISAFSRTLKDYKVSLMDYFGESWTYSACMHLLRECESLTLRFVQPQTTLLTLQTVRGELMHTARIQLDRLGGATSLFINPINGSRTPPSSETALNSIDETIDKPIHEKLTNTELIQALCTSESFDSLYKNLTLETIDSFQNCGRTRIINSLQSDLAYLNFIREKYKDAADIWKRVCATYETEGWRLIETVIIEKLCICYEKLGMADEHFQCLLHLMAFGKLLQPPLNLVSLAENLIQTVQTIENTVILENNSMFTLDLVQTHNPISDDGDILMEINVDSRFPVPLDVSAVKVISTGADLKELTCSSEPLQLKCGLNVIKLKGKRPMIPGTYTPTSCIIGCTKLFFEYQLHPNCRKKALRIAETDGSIRMSVKLHDTDEAHERTSRIEFTIMSSQVSWTNASLSIVSLTGMGVVLPDSFTGRIIKDGKEEDFVSRLIKSSLAIPDVTENTAISFFLNYDPDSIEPNRQSEHRLKLSLKAQSLDGAPFVHASISKIQLTRPLHVQFSSLSLPTMSLIKFETSNMDTQPIRVLAQEMVCGTGLTLQLHATNDVLLFPEQVTTSVFDISNLAPSENETELEFCLKMWYLPVSDEIAAFFTHHLQLLLKEKSLQNYSNFAIGFLKRHILPKINLVEVVTYGDLPKIELDVAAMNEVLRKESQELRDTMMDLFHDILDKTKGTMISEIRSQTAALMKPTLYQYRGLVQQSSILVHCRIAPSASTSQTSTSSDSISFWDSFKPIVFESFPCELVIQNVLWKLPDHSHLKSIELDYEVELGDDDFELSGKRSGKFLLKRKETVRIPLYLCPLKPGKTFLPSVKLQCRAGTDPELASRIITHCLTRLTALTVYPRSISEKMFLGDAVQLKHVVV